MIEVHDLTRRYGNLLAVDGLDLSVAKGEVVGFLGPNGAGKTTTMRILTGYLPATRAARLVVAGHDVLRDSMSARRSIGYLPESVPLYPELRVDEMMRFQARLHRMERSTLRARIPEVLERVGVRDRSKQLVGTLSRGLKQRVGLAVALLPSPEVLILDEPTSGLDPIQRAEVRRLILELSSEHTVLLSSHILAEVEAMAPRVAIIHEGKKVADGSKEQILEELGGGDAGHVAVELAAPASPEEVAELLAALPGVTAVETGERVGIHQAFRLRGEGDLREDVGALAMTRSWALRELTWERPSLEQLFTRLVTGEVDEEPTPKESAPAASVPATAPVPPDAPIALDPIPKGRELPLGTPGTANKRTIYSLNPFDRGASRDLSKPVDVDAPAPPPEDGA
ncbi:MAG: ABC transporter ATP-binding protein [Planctomycetota bacterium]